jgi:hypothetical protein
MEKYIDSGNKTEFGAWETQALITRSMQLRWLADMASERHDFFAMNGLLTEEAMIDAEVYRRRRSSNEHSA